MKRSDWIIATTVPLIVGVCLVVVWQRLVNDKPPAPATAIEDVTPQEPPLVDIDIKPDPSLQPQDVVRIVVDALRRNDSPQPDTGIAVSFRFASPGNKEQTGPLERFGSMVKSGFYPMLAATGADFGPVEIDDKLARQTVRLTYDGNKTIVYLFVLSRQTGEAFKDCWMTDAVFPLRPRPEPPTPEAVPEAQEAPRGVEI